MDWMLVWASRMTHIKIFVVAVVAAGTFVVIGLNARIDRIDAANGRAPIRAGDPSIRAGQETPFVR
jgi:hypothetical protein